MRLLSYNIRYGGRGREGTIASVIKACAPDLVVLQEATDPAVVSQLAQATGLTAFGARPGQSLGYLARMPPASAEWHWLGSARHAHLDLQPAGTSWRVIGVHLRAMHVRWAERRRVLDVEALLRSLDAAAARRHVIVGDFNSLPPGSTLELERLPWRLRPLVWIGGRKMTWRAVQAMEEAGYTDAWAATRDGEPGVTFPAASPHLRLDYAFAPRAFAGALTRCRPVTDAPGVRVASDHLPLLLTIDEPEGA